MGDSARDQDNSSRMVDSTSTAPESTATGGNTTPKTIIHDQRRLTEGLESLRIQFKLTDEQLAALPELSEISLLEQNDSHRILSHEGVRFAHPFKLYVGAMKWEMDGEKGRDSAYVYLFEGQRKHMKMLIGSGEANGHWEPMDIMYYATLTKLAYPWNEWEGVSRFVAVVKFYFTLGRIAGLYTVDPGFQFAKTWARDLQGACDELKEENRRSEIARQIAAGEWSTEGSRIRHQESRQEPRHSPILPVHQRTEEAYGDRGIRAMSPPTYVNQPPMIARASLSPPDIFSDLGNDYPTHHFELRRGESLDVPRNRLHSSRSQSSLREKFPTEDDDEVELGASSYRPRSYQGGKAPSAERSRLNPDSQAVVTQNKHGISTRTDHRAVPQTEVTRPIRLDVLRAEHLALIESEYIDLYNSRNETQSRMNEIRGELSDEQYRVLMARIKRRPNVAYT
ncbi:hypothetical protein N0V83_007293 [Neocucurbitaria cava]|uniref:Uncharacterized protein n=1 Tax=Neocucurbitaria cava TaxID=798079 RepID=A0A9W8Y3M0_9PLEO|nr:hypothetical protein N0V83_007293 [Neocucurbitaria cava]